MENVLLTMKNETINLDKIVVNEIQSLRSMIESEADKPLINLYKINLKYDNYLHIFNRAVITNILDLTFYKSCIQNMKSCELEFMEMVHELTQKYNLEENFYLEICKAISSKCKLLQTFYIILEDSVLRPQKYNY
jgi:hypothetical protein